MLTLYCLCPGRRPSRSRPSFKLLPRHEAYVPTLSRDIHELSLEDLELDSLGPCLDRGRDLRICKD